MNFETKEINYDNIFLLEQKFTDRLERTEYTDHAGYVFHLKPGWKFFIDSSNGKPLHKLPHCDYDSMERRLRLCVPCDCYDCAVKLTSKKLESISSIDP